MGATLPERARREGVNAGLTRKSSMTTFTGGAAAADHVVTTMAKTLKQTDPERIIKVFDNNPGKRRLSKMWDITLKDSRQMTPTFTKTRASLVPVDNK
jgi:hypothetical protein